MIDIQRPRLRFTARLEPALGSAFQPTGFPDIGAAKFETQDDQGVRHDNLLVESAQSMANRLEAVAWDAGAQEPAELIAALAYVRVVRAGSPEEFLTSSRLEAHRLASAFVRDSTLDGKLMLGVIGERLGLAKDTPLNYPHMARAVLQLDPFALIHGVFFSHKEWLGQPKFPRAVSSVIEAYDVKPLMSGGRKADVVRHQLDKDEEGGGTSEGYGSIPFHRIEWTAREISAKFSVDVELLRSYGLGDEMTELLTALALWEIRGFLTSGLRLRTACDLEVIETPKELPEQDELTSRIAELIHSQSDLLGPAGPLNVQWQSGKTKPKKTQEK